ncbi:acetylornithine transaminase [Bacillaceae bacterium Marseille-Q3522]|nr:acetylornithine transaminase [Bacillaceae bacterium Marseille-Q3522]
MSHLFPTYTKWEIEPESAKGCYLYDKKGKKYLDFTSGIGVCNLGHRPEVVEKAVQDQLQKYWHLSNMYTIEKQEECAALLAKAAGLEYVFFANSGAEANEGAIKLARKATGRNKIITFYHSFHGRTFATMAATAQDKIKTGFGQMLEKFVYVPFNDITALKAALDEETAAVMLEIVQGEGGIHVADGQFLSELEQLCHKNGSLLIIDEIQTGLARTGKAFSYQHFNLTPDIVTAAKALANGFPLGAVIGSKKLKDVFGPGSHGSTFGGNPVSVAAAVATLQTLFTASFLSNVKETSAYLAAKLEEIVAPLSAVVEIRGLGMMIGIELTTSVTPILQELRGKGFIALPAGEKVLRLLPPLIVTKAEIDQAVAFIAEGLASYSMSAV